MKATDKLGGFAGEWSEYVLEYFKIHFLFFKYELGEQLFAVVSVLLSRLVSIFILMLSFVFASGAITFYVGHIIGSLPLSFFLVAVTYCLMAWLIYKARKPFISNHTFSLLFKNVFSRKNLNVKTMKEYPGTFGHFLEKKEHVRLRKIQMDKLVRTELIHSMNEITDVDGAKRRLIRFMLTQRKRFSSFLDKLYGFSGALNENRETSILRSILNSLRFLFRKIRSS